MIYKIVHRSTYKYKYPVSVGNHVACLKPRSSMQHQLTKNVLDIQPKPATRTERIDYFGNRLCFFTVQEPHTELVVEARSEVKISDQQTPWPKYAPSWEEVVAALPKDYSISGLDAFQFAFESPRYPASAGVCGLCATVLHSRPSDARGALRPDDAHQHRLSFRLESDDRKDAS